MSFHMKKHLTDEDDQYNGNARHTYLTGIWFESGAVLINLSSITLPQLGPQMVHYLVKF
jgi:hypothetical protein